MGSASGERGIALTRTRATSVLFCACILAGLGEAARAPGLQAAPEDELIRVAPDRWTFETSRSHRRFVPWGANFVLRDRKSLDMFAPGVYDRALYGTVLAALEALNVNIVKAFLPIGRVLPDPQGPGATIAAGYLENVADFLTLARARRIRVVLTLAEWWGNDVRWWHDGGEYFGRSPWRAEGVDSLAVLASFWSQVGERFRGDPTIFSYALCVEWSLPNHNLTTTPQPTGRVETEPGLWYWRRWALSRRRSLPALNRAWRTAYASIDEIPLVDYSYDAEARAYLDDMAKILDYQDFREWASFRYFRPQVEALRRADPGRMIAIGNLCRPPGSLWEGAARHFSGFSAPEETVLVDYMACHDNREASEPADGDIVDVVRDMQLRLRASSARRRMPVIMEEFSLSGTADAGLVTAVGTAMVRGSIGHCSGWMRWFLQAWDGESADGLLDADLRPTAWGLAFGALGAPGGEVASADLRRLRGRRVVRMNRRSELVPRGPGELWRILWDWDRYRHPVDLRWPRNRWIGLKLN